MTLPASRAFTNQRPIREHLLRSGEGVEIANLRRDTAEAFAEVESTASLPTANLTALAALDMTGGTEGTMVYVLTVRRRYIYDPDAAETADGFAVLDATGGGQWFSMDDRHPHWLRQAEFYFDKTAGDNEATGLTGEPIQDWAEYLRRVGLDVYYNQRVDLYFSVGDFALADPVILRPIIGPTGLLYIHGTLTSTATGTFTTATPRVTATNTPVSIADTEHDASWASDVSALMAITGGTAGSIGATAWVMANLDSNACRLSSLLKANTTSNSFVALTEVNPTVDDEYELFSLTTVSILDIVVRKSARSSGAAGGCIIENLRVNQSSYTSRLMGDRRGGLDVLNCRFSTNVFLDGVRMDNCLIDGTCATTFGTGGGSGLGNVSMNGGGCIGRSLVPSGTTFNNGFLFQGSTIGSLVVSSGSYCNISDMGIMDWSTVVYGVIVQGGSVLDLGTTGKLWGSSEFTGTYGVAITGGVLRAVAPSGLTIEGLLHATKDFQVSGNDSLPVFDRTLDPPAYAAAPLRACTWANLVAAIGSGGFAGNAVEPGTLSGIVKDT